MLKVRSMDRSGGMVCRIVLCRDVMPLLRMRRLTDTSHSVCNICVKSPSAVVNVSKDDFTVCIEFHSIHVNVYLISD